MARCQAHFAGVRWALSIVPGCSQRCDTDLARSKHWTFHLYEGGCSSLASL